MDFSGKLLSMTDFIYNFVSTRINNTSFIKNEMEIQFTDDNVKDYIAGEKPVLVDCWATWCGPCVRMSPIIEQLAEEFEGKACIGKYNVDENTELAAEFRIMSIPTILLFKGGKMVERLAGSQSKSLLEEKINNLL